MRRMEHLIYDVRFNTNNEDTNRYSDLRMLKFFNDAQKAVYAVIFTSELAGEVFEKEKLYDMVANQEEYDLPSDIYAKSSINSVGRLITGQGATNPRYSSLPKITGKEENKSFGYRTRGSSLVISPSPKENITSGIRMLYNRKLPTLSIRLGKVGSLSAGVSITLDSAYGTDFTNFDEFITVVDEDGAIIRSGIRVTGYNTGTGVISTADALTSVTTDHYVVIGKYATSHPDLPDEVEPFLTAYVEKRINAVDSSPDIGTSVQFSNTEKANLISIFEKKDNDVKYPPIVDDTYIAY